MSTEINLGGGFNLEMKSARMVNTHQTLYLTIPDKGTITLSVNISADFDTIP